MSYNCATLNVKFCAFFVVALLWSVVPVASAQSMIEAHGAKLQLTLKRVMTLEERAAQKRSFNQTLAKAPPPLSIEEEISRGGNDMIVIADEDDFIVRFRLSNPASIPIYYLVATYNDLPAGYILFREKRSVGWSATSPAYGRSGSFTGGGYKWVQLAPNQVIEFEFSDSSSRCGEHAVSIFINAEPNHNKRLELISDIYEFNQCSATG